jgi:hypothetical protein
MTATLSPGGWFRGCRVALSLVLVLSLPAPSLHRAVTLGAGAVLQAPFGAMRVRGHSDTGASNSLSGEVDAECGCLLESSCTHGSRGVAAARRLQLLEQSLLHDRRPDERTADEVAFIRTVLFAGGDQATAERSAVARSTCVREGLRRGAVRGRPASRVARSNSTSSIGEHGFRTAGSSLAVIAKRTTRSWTPDGMVTRMARSVRASNHVGDLTMMNKLVMPRLLSPSADAADLSIRGELISRLRGLNGRYEVAKSDTKPSPLLMLCKDQDSEACSAAEEPSVQHSLVLDGADSGATLGAYHAPQVAREVYEVPASDSWLEEGNADDEGIPQLVAALLRRVAEEGDRSIEEDCEVVATSKDVQQRSAFHAQRRPKVSLADYAERICKYGGCSPGCLGLSLVYMDRFLRQMDNYRLTGLSVHRLLLSCVLVATKQWDDTHYNNAFWAKVGGVSNAELNSLERQLLATLDYSLLVDKAQWDAYRSALKAWGAAATLRADVDVSSLAGTHARFSLDTALSSPHLRHSLIFACARGALASSSCDDLDLSALPLKHSSAADTCTKDLASSSEARRHAASQPSEAAVAAVAAGSPVTPEETEDGFAMKRYSPEGPEPGSNTVMLATDESDGCEPASEEIYLAAAAQMYGGMRPKGSVGVEGGRTARQQLTGGAMWAANNAVPLQRCVAFDQEQS